MKKICITFVLIGIIILTALAINIGDAKTEEYLRIHIRANSNLESDQQIKYEVKNEVIAFLTPYISTCSTKEQAEKMLVDNLKEIEKVANSTLQKNGFSYTSKAKVVTEEFPLRTYGEFTLEEGFYDALIIELGNADGNNWWCVVYPPLCFVGNGSGNYVYKSKILDIINKFKNR